MSAKDFLVSVLKAAVLSLIFGLCGILIFAFIVKVAVLSDGVIKTVNQFIKVISVFLGCFFAVKGNLGIVKGGVAGVIFTLLLYSVFALMSGSSVFSLLMLADLCFTALVGGISGIVSVNLKGKE